MERTEHWVQKWYSPMSGHWNKIQPENPPKVTKQFEATKDLQSEQIILVLPPAGKGVLSFQV